MSLGDPEGQLVVAVHVVGVEAVEVDEVWPEVVDDGAEAEPVPPRRRHVDDVDLAVGDMLTPILQVLGSLKGHSRACSGRRRGKKVLLRQLYDDIFIISLTEGATFDT